MEEKQIKVLLVDDHEMVRKGLRLLLMAFDDLQLVGETDSVDEAIQLCHDQRPDVIIMDMVMPKTDGIEATRQILSHYPHVKILALTSYREASSVQKAVQAGAIGYLMKDVSINHLANAIRDAHAGKPTFDESALKALMAAASAPPSPFLLLTDREKEVLGLMIEGLSNPEIATRLTIGRSTVKSHVSHIFDKLGVKSRLEAVAMANLTDWNL